MWEWVKVYKNQKFKKTEKIKNKQAMANKSHLSLEKSGRCWHRIECSKWMNALWADGVRVWKLKELKMEQVNKNYDG